MPCVTPKLLITAFGWQVPAGWLASRIGGKTVLLMAVGLWTIATLLVWPAYDAGVGFVVLARVLVGVAEGGNYPAQICLNARWIPVSERSRSWAFLTSGESLGTIIAMAGCPFLYHYLGWQAIFWVSAIMCVVWAAAFAAFTHSSPEDSPTISPRELGYILRNREQELSTTTAPTKQDLPALVREQGSEPAPVTVPWGEFFQSSAFWGLIVAHFAYNWGTYVIGSWLPIYFDSMFQV